MTQEQAQNLVDALPLLRGRSFPKGTYAEDAAGEMAKAKGVPLASNGTPWEADFLRTFSVTPFLIGVLVDQAPDGQEGDAVWHYCVSRLTCDGWAHLLPEVAA